MNTVLRALGVGLCMSAVACTTDKPRADSTATMAAPDTMRAAPGSTPTSDSMNATSADSVSAKAKSPAKAPAKAAPNAATKQSPIIGRDSVIMPGPKGLIAIPTIADTAKKKKPPR